MVNFDTDENLGGSDTYMRYSYTLPGPGTWDLTFDWATTTNDGTDADSDQFTRTITVPDGYSGAVATGTILIPIPPPGGNAYLSIFGGNGLGGVITASGTTHNYDCLITF